MAKIKIDNFNNIQSLLTFDSADNFYYVVVIRRGKDNNYDEFPYREIAPGRNDEARYIAGFIIKSYDDILEYKDIIISMCEENNARAYITINEKSLNTVNNESMSTNEYICEPSFMVACFEARVNDPENYPRTLLDVNFDDEFGFYEVDDFIAANGLEPIFVTWTPNSGKQYVFPDRDVTEVDFSEFDKYEAARIEDQETDVTENPVVQIMPDEMTILYANLQ